MKNDNVKPLHLVTGAAGFIGMHLIKLLLAEGCEVVGIDNLNNYYSVELKLERLKCLNKYDDFTFYKIDMTNEKELEELFSKYTFNTVIHLAAQAGVRYSIENPQAYIQSNIVGFSLLIEICQRKNIKHFMYASSSSVYGDNTKVPFSVDDKTDFPASLYAATKKANEVIAHSYSYMYKLPTTGLRFFTVYGPYGRPDMAYFLFTKNIFEDKPIKIFNHGNMYRDFTYIDDIVLAISKLIDNSSALHLTNDIPYKLYNIGNNRPVKIIDFIEIIEKAIGKEAIKEFYPMQKGEVYKTYADISDLEKDIAFKPSTKIEIGIENFIFWYRQYYTIV